MHSIRSTARAIATSIAQLAYEDKRLHDRIDNPTSPRARTASSIRSKLALVGDFRDRLPGRRSQRLLAHLHARRSEDRADLGRADRRRPDGPENRRNLPQVELRLQAPEPHYRQRQRAARALRAAGLQEPRLGRENLARRPQRSARLSGRRSERRQRHPGHRRGCAISCRASRSSKATSTVLGFYDWGQRVHQRKAAAQPIRRTSARSRATA